MGLTWTAFVLMGFETVVWWLMWEKLVVPTEDRGVEMK